MKYISMPDRSVSPAAGTDRPVRVLKFGGTSVGSADGLHNVSRIIRDARSTCFPVVVVSAAGGITDDLVRAAEETRGDRSTAEAWVRHIGRRYRSLATDAIGDAPPCSRYETVLRAELSELRRALQNGTGPNAGAARDAVLATGERLTAPLLATLLTTDGCPARPVDATALIRTDDVHGDATVQWPPTCRRVHDWFQEWTQEAETAVPVITGFIGATSDGSTTTIGRGGSDLSAAILARALKAERLERWTDMDGLYTRDPATHDDARRLDRLDFEQARTWTKAGRLGMHPCTLDPPAAADIPVHVRCTHRPEAEGTRIVPAASAVPS